MNGVKFPAVSHEMKFIATYVDEVNDIRNNSVEIEESCKNLSDKVYERAKEDARELLDQLKSDLEDEAHSFSLRINGWHSRQNGWETYSEIYWGLQGRRKSVGSAGLHIGWGKEGFRLICWMKCLGGLDGLRKFAENYKEKKSGCPYPSYARSESDGSLSKLA